VLNGVLLPVVVILMLMLINRADLMASTRTPASGTSLPGHQPHRHRHDHGHALGMMPGIEVSVSICTPNLRPAREE